MSASAANFEALADFKRSLTEVDILCAAAATYKEDEAKYATFNKAALLLIAGKFETFAESIAEEFVFRINESKIPFANVSPALRMHHSFYVLREFQNDQFRGKAKEAIEILRQIGKIWASTETASNLKIETKFNFGKHGDKELEKLFERIGVDQLFHKIVVTEVLETVSEDKPVPTVVDFRGIFNSVCAMRNNILHEDATPTINSEQILKIRKQFEEFAISLHAFLVTLLPA